MRDPEPAERREPQTSMEEKMTKRVLTPGLIVLLSVICATSAASAQTRWWKTYGGTNNDYGSSVQQTTDGGYIVVGYVSYSDTGHTVPADVYLIKTNAQGDTIWTRTYGGANGDGGFAVQLTADGGYIIAGVTYSFGPGTPDYGNVYLVKTNAQGDTLWTRAYGGPSYEECNSVQPTSDGGYIIIGTTWSFGAGCTDAYLIKTNASGETLWTRTYGGVDYDYGYSVQQTWDGGYVVTGYGYSFGAQYSRAYLIKTNAQGDTLWTRIYGGTQATDHSSGHSVQQTADSGYIVAGTCCFSDERNEDVYLVKTDSLGNVGVAEESPKPQATSGKLAATVTRSLPHDAVAFDAMGRRVLNPRPGIYFVRTTATAAPRKVLLVE